MFSAIVAASLAHAQDVITLPQLRVLVLVATRDNVTIGAVADVLDVHASSAGRLCDRLVGAGLLERRAPSTDRRTFLLNQTPRVGSPRVDHGPSAAGARDGTASHAPGDRHGLRHFLDLFAEAAGEPSESALIRPEVGRRPEPRSAAALTEAEACATLDRYAATHPHQWAAALPVLARTVGASPDRASMPVPVVRATLTASTDSR